MKQSIIIVILALVTLSGCSNQQQVSTLRTGNIELVNGLILIPGDSHKPVSELTRKKYQESQEKLLEDSMNLIPMGYEHRSGFDFSQEKIISKQRTTISRSMSDEENINGNNTSSGILLTIHRQDLGIEVQYSVSRNNYITHQRVLLNDSNWNISYQDFTKLDLANIKLQGISETLFTYNIGERGKVTVVGYQRRKHHNSECAPDDLSSKESRLQLLDSNSKASSYKLMSETYDYHGNEGVIDPMPSPISGCRKNDPLGGSAIPLQLRIRDNFGIILPYNGFGDRGRVTSIRPI